MKILVASFLLSVTSVTATDARSPASDARAGIAAFSGNCFSPRLTAEKAREAFNFANIRHDFYDLDPFTSAAPSPAKADVAPGTDRRCEVSFNGDFAQDAVTAVAARLLKEGITSPADLPETYTETDGTALLAARRLNPNKIAVVHVGTRPTTNGVETFLNVERLVAPEKKNEN